MKIFNRIFQNVVFFLVIGFFLPGFNPVSGQGEQQSGEVKIVIRNSTFEFQGGILKPNEMVTIVVDNQDRIEHGFTSVFLEDLNVQVETEGATTFGRGIKGVHIRPGKTVRLHFISTRSGRFSFQCDLHPAMKGEFLFLSIGVI